MRSVKKGISRYFRFPNPQFKIDLINFVILFPNINHHFFAKKDKQQEGTIFSKKCLIKKQHV